MLYNEGLIYDIEKIKKSFETESNMTEKTTLVVTSVPNLEQQEAMISYVQGVMPLLLNLGGGVIKRSIVTDTYHGDKNFTFLLIMDFPSKSHLIDMFESDEYKLLIPDREKGFEKINIFFAGDIK